VAEPEKGSYLYHPEEEFFESVSHAALFRLRILTRSEQKATASHTYAFKTAAPRDAESFGVEQFGRLMLVPASAMDGVITEMIEACR
jgi:protein BCP1